MSIRVKYTNSQPCHFPGLSFVGERVKDFCPLHHPNSRAIYGDANNLVSKNPILF